MIESTAVFSH